MSSTSSVPIKRQRNRVSLNCEECRRTKARCSRSWPCTECVRKGLSDICPNDSFKPTAIKPTSSHLQRKIRLLEDALRRHGLDPETETSLNKTVSEAGEVDQSPKKEAQAILPPARAEDVSELLTSLALGRESASKTSGTETSAFFLSSDSELASDDSMSDNKSDAQWLRQPKIPVQQRECNRTPWGRKRKTNIAGRADLPGELLDRCRSLLPSRRASLDMFEKFWNSTAWRIRPMTRAFFLDTIIPGIYDSQEGAHPHHLAVLFATQAMASLFDDSEAVFPASPSPTDYHETAYDCLVAGNFYTETTTASLIAIHLIGSFLLNSDERRGPDGIFTLFGLAIRLAVIGGYHRDKPKSDVGQAEHDLRRRIWFELLAAERVNCMVAFLPDGMRASHYDTQFPTDEDLHGYFIMKWKLGESLARIAELWSAARPPSAADVSQADQRLRALFHSIPSSLRISVIPLAAFASQDDGPLTSSPFSLRVNSSSNSPGAFTEALGQQQHRLATHFCLAFVYLHMPLFMRAVSLGNDFGYSLQTVDEASGYMIDIVESVMRLHRSMSRWFSFTADLYTILVCQTARLLKSSIGQETYSRLHLIERGVAILDRTSQIRPNAKNRAVAKRAQRLLNLAKATRGGDAGVTGDFASTSGFATQLAIPTEFGAGASSNHSLDPFGLMKSDKESWMFPDTDFDFDQWLSQLQAPETGEI